jgi:transcriptional regulator with XRE-family HTH domain
MGREAQDGDEIAQLDYTDETATFGDRLALAREAIGLDQAQLAQRMGIKRQTLQDWEEDRAEPRANRLQLLAGMLNVSMVWLMTGQGSAPRSGRPAGVEACLFDLRDLRAEQTRLLERLERIETRLRAALD